MRVITTKMTFLEQLIDLAQGQPSSSMINFNFHIFLDYYFLLPLLYALEGMAYNKLVYIEIWGMGCDSGFGAN